jgi:acyl carrier protein
VTTTPTPVRPDALALVRDVLGVVCELPESRIDRSTPLADIGADSLALVELAEIVEERLVPYLPGLHIPDADLGSFQTVGDVADYLARLL